MGADEGGQPLLALDVGVAAGREGTRTRVVGGWAMILAAGRGGPGKEAQPCRAGQAACKAAGAAGGTRAESRAVLRPPMPANEPRAHSADAMVASGVFPVHLMRPRLSATRAISPAPRWQQAGCGGAGEGAEGASGPCGRCGRCARLDGASQHARAPAHSPGRADAQACPAPVDMSRFSRRSTSMAAFLKMPPPPSPRPRPPRAPRGRAPAVNLPAGGGGRGEAG